MSAPVKNFTDPTTLSFMPAPYAFPPVTPPPAPKMFALSLQLWNHYKFGLMTPSITRKSIPVPFTPMLPIPPMGRQVLLTFPPIYRERGGGSNRPSQGELWPRLQPAT